MGVGLGLMRVVSMDAELEDEAIWLKLGCLTKRFKGEQKGSGCKREKEREEKKKMR